MRLTINLTATAICALLAASGAILAQSRAAQDAVAQCQNKPNLTAPVATLGRVDVLAGYDPKIVTDDALMVDLDVAVENAGAVDAPRSQLRYEAEVRTTAGKLVQKSSETTDVFGPSAGEVEHMLFSIMVGKLAACLQPSGEIAATLVIRAQADVKNEVDECDETDNASETTLDLKTEKIVS